MASLVQRKLEFPVKKVNCDKDETKSPARVTRRSTRHSKMNQENLDYRVKPDTQSPRKRTSDGNLFLSSTDGFWKHCGKLGNCVLIIHEISASRNNLQVAKIWALNYIFIGIMSSLGSDQSVHQNLFKFTEACYKHYVCNLLLWCRFWSDCMLISINKHFSQF